MLSFGKRVPQYQTDGSRVTLRLYNGSLDERMARLVAKWQGEGRAIELDELLMLSYLREHAFIDTRSGSALLQCSLHTARAILDRLAQPGTGILERRGGTRAATYHLTKGVAKDLLGKAAYTKTRGLDRVRYPEMVKAFLRDHGSMTPKECRELLGLGESPSAKSQMSRLLRKWSGEGGFLRREGKTRGTRYFLQEES